MPFRVLLIEDCHILRESLTALLNASRRFELVAEAEGLDQALELYRAIRPAVVLVGPGLFAAERIDVVAGLLSNVPDAKIVTALLHDDDETISEAVRSGVLGVVGRKASFETLLDVLTKIAEGGTHYEHLSDVLLSYLREIGPAARQRLAPRELRVLRMIAAGKSSKEIANDLGLAVETIRYYRKSIMRKLNVHNVAALLQVAAAENLISLARGESG
jgi:DNA-binding NarL/FixJ family response regulator